MNKKKCSRCKRYKPLENFSKAKNHLYEKHAYCKECRKEYRIEYKKKWPWKLTWRYMHNRCDNPNHTFYAKYGGKGIKNLITVDDIKKLWYRDQAWKLKQPSLDRKDPKGNYTPENCRFIEFKLNSSKPHMSYEERRDIALKAMKTSTL